VVAGLGATAGELDSSAAARWPDGRHVLLVAKRLRRIARECLPAGTDLEYLAYQIPPLTTFPPLFAVQGFRLPRMLYPFEICMYHWQLRAVASVVPSRHGG